jgi:hypothetical protein
VFNFNFGKKKPDIKQYAIIAIILSVITATLSQCTGISQNNLWDILDEIQRKYFPQTILNEFIIQDDEKLKRRIDRDVNTSTNTYIGFAWASMISHKDKHSVQMKQQLN